MFRPPVATASGYHSGALNSAVNQALSAEDSTQYWKDANVIATKDLAWFPLIERVKSISDAEAGDQLDLAISWQRSRHHNITVNGSW